MGLNCSKLETTVELQDVVESAGAVIGLVDKHGTRVIFVIDQELSIFDIMAGGTKRPKFQLLNTFKEDDQDQTDLEDFEELWEDSTSMMDV